MTHLGTRSLALLIVPLLAGCPDRPQPPEPPGTSSLVQKRGRALTIPLQGAEWVHAGDHIDILLTLAEPQTQELMTMTSLQNTTVMEVGENVEATRDHPAIRPVTVMALPEEAEVLLMGLRSGAASVSLRNPEDIDIQEERGRATLTTLLTGERINTLLRKRTAMTRPEPKP